MRYGAVVSPQERAIAEYRQAHPEDDDLPDEAVGSLFVVQSRALGIAFADLGHALVARFAVLPCKVGFHRSDGSRVEHEGGWNEVWSRCTRCGRDYCIETDDPGPGLSGRTEP